MKFALEVRYGREQASQFASRLEERIRSAGGSISAEDEPPELVVAVGGDGTMLAGVRRALEHDVPVLGFNLGTIGFLTEAEPEAIDEVVDRLIDGLYEIDERMTISATVDGVTSSGLNDVVIEKIDSQRLVELAVSIDGTPFVTYRADGIILATPTGSTAYSFSAGGPLLDHAVEALILTPVAAHSLFDRSIVLPATSTIEVRVVRDRPVHVTVDKNDLGRIVEGELVTIRKGSSPARLVSLRPRSFASLVRSKFDLD